MQRDLDTVRHILRVLESAPGKPDQRPLVRDQPPLEGDLVDVDSQAIVP